MNSKYLVHSPFSDWWRSVLVPVGLGVLAFVAVQLLTVRYSGRKPDRSWADMQPVRAVEVTNVALQIAVHNVVETAPRPVGVRVCRSLVNQPVTIHSRPEDTVSAILGNLARQVGTDVTSGIEDPQDQALPTIVCPGGRTGDYLTIGTAAPQVPLPR